MYNTFTMTDEKSIIASKNRKKSVLQSVSKLHRRTSMTDTTNRNKKHKHKQLNNHIFSYSFPLAYSIK